MPRLLVALASAVLATTAAAQAAPPPAGPPGAAPPPASAPAQPAPAGGNAKAIDKAKSLGKLGLQRVAPKLGRAEKLVRKADPVVEKAVDLAAEKAGLAPRR